MLAYIIRRLLQAILVMVVMSGLVFVGLYVVGDPVSMMASPEVTELERHVSFAKFTLYIPLLEQYAIFMSHAVRLDFGKSFLTGQSAMGLILERMPATLELAVVSMLLAGLVGVPLGIWAGLRPNALSTRGIMTGSVLGFSLPNFWVGLMLIMVFAVYLGWFPASGKRGIVTAVSERIGMAPTGVRMLQLLADRDRLGMMDDLVTVFRERLLDRRKIVRAELRSAVALTPEEVKAIETELGAVTGMNVAVEAVVDPDLIGGVLAKVGSTVYDGTVKSQLNRLRKQLVG